MNKPLFLLLFFQYAFQLKTVSGHIQDEARSHCFYVLSRKIQAWERFQASAAFLKSLIPLRNAFLNDCPDITWTEQAVLLRPLRDVGQTLAHAQEFCNLSKRRWLLSQWQGNNPDVFLQILQSPTNRVDPALFCNWVITLVLIASHWVT